MTLGERFQKIHLRNRELKGSSADLAGYERGLLRGIITLSLFASDLEYRAEDYTNENFHSLAAELRAFADKIRAEVAYDIQKVNLPDTTTAF